MASMTEPSYIELAPPWERMPDEKSPVYDAFVIYRDQGPRRSMQKVADKIRRSLSLVSKWAMRFKWRDRALAWDLHLDEIRRQESEQATRDMHERHMGLSLLMQEKVAEYMKSLTPDRLANLSASDILKWLTVSTTLESSSRAANMPETSAPPAARQLSVKVGSTPNSSTVHITETIVRTREDVHAARIAAAASDVEILDGSSEVAAQE
jgi:formate dehydrogenase maturation protein FdhE